MTNHPDTLETPVGPLRRVRKRWVLLASLAAAVVVLSALISAWFCYVAISNWLDPPHFGGAYSQMTPPPWPAVRGKDPIPGIDYSSIACAFWRDGRTAVVVWSDVASSTDYSDGTMAGGSVFNCYQSAANGRVDCRCVSSDGRTGTVTINEKSFDLARGALFLVSTANGQTRVLQLNRDLSQLDRSHITDLAKNDQEISGFFSKFGRAK
jgi:hypothetical protein